MTAANLAPTPPASPPGTPTRSDTIRARFMFALGFVHLLLLAGLIHRSTSTTVSPLELDVMYAGLAVLWPVFMLEVLWGVYRRDRTQPRGPILKRAVLVALLPPWRMALTDPRTGLIWVPRIGWQKPGKELFKRLEQAFAGPMVLFAFLILPVLLFEYVRSEQIRETQGLALALDIGIAAIWLAFATEFVFKASAHPKPFKFARERWLDVAIVVLPLLEFILTKWVDAAPLARLLRAGRALSPEQITRMQRLYRLQGLATKAWHALLLLEGVARLFGVTPEKRLARAEEKIAELEEEIAELRKEADEWQAMIAERDAAKALAAAPEGVAGPVTRS
jgi:hypothetical protein